MTRTNIRGSRGAPWPRRKGHIDKYQRSSRSARPRGMVPSTNIRGSRGAPRPRRNSGTPVPKSELLAHGGAGRAPAWGSMRIVSVLVRRRRWDARAHRLPLLCRAAFACACAARLSRSRASRTGRGRPSPTRTFMCRTTSSGGRWETSLTPSQGSSSDLRGMVAQGYHPLFFFLVCAKTQAKNHI